MRKFSFSRASGLLFLLCLFTTLLVCSASADADRLFLSAPEGSTVTVSSTALGQDSVISCLDGVFDGQESYTAGCAYSFAEYSCPAADPSEVSAISASGEALTPFWVSDDRCVFLPAGSEELRASLQSTVEGFFDAYLYYTCHGGESGMWCALVKVLPGSDLYAYIQESREAMIFASSVAMEFDTLEYSGFQMVGDNAFVCTVRYSAQCTMTTWYETTSYPLANACEMLFVRSSGEWKAAALLDLTGYVPVPLDALTDPEADVQVVDIAEGRCKGKMIVVKDPTRVFLGTMDNIGREAGLQLTALAEKYQAIGGTNAGGFNDDNGNGNGGIPQGLVITEGTIVYGSASTAYNVVGLDASGQLVLGAMTGDQALAAGVVSGVSFTTHTGNGSALIIGGLPQTQNFGTGVNPRTAIAQLSDGTLLLLVLDGRCPDTLGVRLSEECALLEKFGAVNAGNLDGGSSSTLVYEGAIQNNCSSCTGPRRIPTAFLVK